MCFLTSKILYSSFLFLFVIVVVECGGGFFFYLFVFLAGGGTVVGPRGFFIFKKKSFWNFPGGPVVGTPPADVGSIPGPERSHIPWCN